MGELLTKNNKIDVKVKVTPLGNITKFASAPAASTNADYVAANAAQDMSPLLRHKWERKQRIGDIIKANFKLRLKFRRVLGCCRTIVKGDSVKIVRSAASGNAAYHNLLTCGNVWACPICAAKIQARRGEEISRAVDWAYSHGYKVAMITRTQPHHAGQALRDIIAGHAAATRKYKAGRWYQDFKGALGVIGSIRASEVTYGLNGWHWHSHELLLYKDEQALLDYSLALKGRWIACCEAAGLPIADKGAMMAYGVDIMTGCRATDYLTKLGKSWGVDKEISRASAKRGAGLTPFELAEQGEAELFAEYLLATAGKAQLVWSRGLKELVGVDEATDEEIAEAAEDTTETIAEVSRLGWSAVLDEHAEAELLTVATQGGYDAVRAWFALRGLADEVCQGSVFDSLGGTVFNDALPLAG